MEKEYGLNLVSWDEDDFESEEELCKTTNPKEVIEKYNEYSGYGYEVRIYENFYGLYWKRIELEDIQP